MPTLEKLLRTMRAAGWMVACHNDYEAKDQASNRTYWMFTHPSGRWVDGDSATDVDALTACCDKAGVNPWRFP